MQRRGTGRDHDMFIVTDAHRVSYHIGGCDTDLGVW